MREMAWLTLEDAHWRLSAYPAFCAGFTNRGVIRVGAAADIVVYDYKNLDILPPRSSSISRLTNGGGCSGPRATATCSSTVEVTIEDDKQTGVPAGRLLRHGG